MLLLLFGSQRRHRIHASGAARSYKATSFPPSNFDINKDIQIPEFFDGFMNDWVAAKKAEQLKTVAPSAQTVMGNHR